MPQRLPAGTLLGHNAPPLAPAWADTAPAALPAAPAGGRHEAVAPPRDYTAAARGIAAERLATMTARRTFVALKLTYLDATAVLHGAESQWLREQVRLAEEPVDLWLLRAPLFSGLAGTDPERRRLRQRVRRALQAVFGEPQPTTAFATLR
jgi:hypothetical protein